MIEKAIVLADLALEFIRSAYPADDPKYTPLMTSIDETRKQLEVLEKALTEEEHKQKSAVFKEDCPCPKCNENEASEREAIKECLKEVGLAEIKGVPIPELEEEPELELVYEAVAKTTITTKVDLTESHFTGPAGV